MNYKFCNDFIVIWCYAPYLLRLYPLPFWIQDVLNANWVIPVWCNAQVFFNFVAYLHLAWKLADGIDTALVLLWYRIIGHYACGSMNILFTWLVILSYIRFVVVYIHFLYGAIGFCVNIIPLYLNERATFCALCSLTHPVFYN